MKSKEKGKNKRFGALAPLFVYFAYFKSYLLIG